MKIAHKKAVLVITVIVLGLLALNLTDFGRRLNLEDIQEGAAALQALVGTHHAFSAVLFILSYIAVTLWFPAAALLTLLAGYLFGVLAGTVYVAAAAVLAATMSFLLSRYFLGERIQKNWARPLRRFNEEIRTYGYQYLIMVRLIPMMPFLLINVMAGLTKVPVRTFVWTTAVGSLPGILVFCYAGQELLAIDTVEEVFTWRVMVAFGLLVGFAVLIVLFRYLGPRKPQGGPVPRPFSFRQTRNNHIQR